MTMVFACSGAIGSGSPFYYQSGGPEPVQLAATDMKGQVYATMWYQSRHIPPGFRCPIRTNNTVAFRSRPEPHRGITMFEETPKQALATREAHEALLDLKKIVDEATETA